MRRLGSTCVIVIVIGLALAGCGDDPEDQCREFVEALCSKVAECTGAALGGAADDLKEQCIEQSGKACEGAEEARGDIDACIDAINDVECDGFSASTLPDSCGE